MPDRTVDLLVIGSGIAGAAVAHRAAITHGLRVAVADPVLPGRATAAGAGIVSDHGLDDDEAEQVWLGLVRRSTAEHRGLAEELGDGIARRGRYARVGEVVLASDEGQERALGRFEARLAALPDPPRTHRVTGGDLDDAWPSARPDLVGLLVEGTARVDGRGLAELLLERAVDAGAAVLPAAARFAGGRADRVEVGDQIVAAGSVVVAAGVWTPELLRPLGATVPVLPDRGQIVHLSGGPETDRAPVLKTFDGPYLLGFPGGRVVVGATHGTATDPEASAGDQLDVLGHATAVVPGLRDRHILETRVGFRPASPDGRPIVGAVAEGVTVLAGLGSWGLTFGPLLGRLVAAAVAGDAAALDGLEALAPGRFGPLSPRAE